MSKLDKMLREWVEIDLITKDQASKISDFESTKATHSWVLYGFLLLGAVIIGIGAISLIAANWDQIPGWFKLVIDYILLSIIAGSAFYAYEKKPMLFEFLLVLFMILCLATIGLISQVYHTGGKLYQALLLWSLITIGVAACSKRSLAIHLWIPGFLTGITFFALNSVLLQPIFQDNGAPVIMMMPLICGLLAILCRNIAGEIAQTEALRSWSVKSGVIALIIAESRIWQVTTSKLHLVAYLPAYTLALISVVGIQLSSKYKKTQKALLQGVIILYMVPFHLPLLEIENRLSYAFFTLSVLALMAVFLASLKQRKLFQLFLVALGLRFLILYFQAIGGLASTGIGLIFSGALIIIMVMAWNKHRSAITTWAEGLVK